MKNGTLRRILMIAAGSVFLFSGYKVMQHRLELQNSASYSDKLVQMAVLPNVQYESAASPQAFPAPSDTEDTLDAETIINTDSSVEEETVSDESSHESSDAGEKPVMTASTPKPTRYAPIKVDFDALCEKNQDIVAWIYCPDTPINYPVVQAEDNDYYMHRLLDGSRSYPGTLFMDFRNSDDFTDWNSLIYGHNMRNNSMFGTLPDYKRKAYFDAHSEIYLLTPGRDYVINVLSGLVMSDKAELYNALRPDDEEKDRLLANWLKDTDMDPADYPGIEERLVTLSTCSYEYKNARYVLIGTLEELAS